MRSVEVIAQRPFCKTLLTKCLIKQKQVKAIPFTFIIIQYAVKSKKSFYSILFFQDNVQAALEF